MPRPRFALHSNCPVGDRAYRWRLIFGLLLCLPRLGAETESELVARAAAIHARVFTIDTHLDTPTTSLRRAGWDFGVRHDEKTDLSKCDLPRMREGGLKAGVFAMMVGQGPRTPAGLAAARDSAIRSFTLMREAVAAHSDQCALALSAADGPRIAATGKRAIYESIENGYAIGRDLTLLQTYYQLGMRFFLVVHTGNNDLADSYADPNGPEWGGLSPLGRQAVAECNRLGVVVDGSHAAATTARQLIALSRTPVIFTHSGCAALNPVPRNVDDATIRMLAAKGGVIQIVGVSNHLRAMPPEPARDAEMKRLAAKYGKRDRMTDAQVAESYADYSRLNREHPEKLATIDDFLRHLYHAIDVAGVDHVGVGLDYDSGGGVIGLEDVSKYGNITLALVRKGYSESDIAKIWGGNALRVLRAAEKFAGH